jgi:two pore calcium channel protein 3
MSRFSLFFIAYIIICVYIFMTIFLAVVYNNYRNRK